MKDLQQKYLSNFEANSGALMSTIDDLQGVGLPSDYLGLMQTMNGGEGFLGNEYLILWKAEELHQFNDEYEVAKYAPGLFLFGSNGGGEAFGFDAREGEFTVVMVPFIGMDLKHCVVLARSFTEFLQKLASGDGAFE